MTVPNSLFSKMMITIFENFGTSGRGVGVGGGVRVGTGVSVRTGRGVRVGGIGEGADSVKAGWQAEARKETMHVIQMKRVMNFMRFSFLNYLSSARG
jgi:hypothetical protein